MPEIVKKSVAPSPLSPASRGMLLGAGTWSGSTMMVMFVAMMASGSRRRVV